VADNSKVAKTKERNGDVVDDRRQSELQDASIEYGQCEGHENENMKEAGPLTPLLRDKIILIEESLNLFFFLFFNFLFDFHRESNFIS
jgi:hypothetical protein